jgi:mannitol operon repressor
MIDPDIQDLAKFLEELGRETDRGLPLVGAALIDDRLEDTLRSFFVEGRPASKLLDEANAPLGSFSSRAQACYLLGLIDDFEFAEVELIRKVRNEFAHAKHGTSFKSERVQGLCSSLRSDLPEGAGHPTNDSRFRFTNAVVCVVLRLYYRPRWVALERRQPKTWVAAAAVRWRSVEDERPPSGDPILAILKKHTKT